MNPDTQGLTRGNTPSAASFGLSDEETLSDHDSQPIYRGQRDTTAPVGEECSVTVDGEPLDCRYDLLSASPAGFEWNYEGSGPAQLAIALLAHALNDHFAATHYQRFKRNVVAELPENGWTLSKSEIEQFAENAEVLD
jgi:hypothetical protein